MQTAAIRTVANSLPKDEAILITLLISNRYILFAELCNKIVKNESENYIIMYIGTLNAENDCL